MAGWIEDFQAVVGGVTDVLGATQKTFETITGQKSSDPMTVPEVTTQEQSTKQVQAQANVETPMAAAPWLPIVAILALLLLLD